jgi:hypothetical protein
LPSEEIADACQVVAHEQGLSAIDADVVDAPRLVFAMAERAFEILDVHRFRRGIGGDLFAGELTTGALTLRNYMTFEQDFTGSHFFYVIRLIGALVAVTIVTLLFDRRFRR